MFDIELQTAHSGYDRKTCFVHARGAAIPGDPPAVVVTMHPLRLTGTDVFYEIYDMRTDDGGKTWTEPTSRKDTLGRRAVEGGVEEAISGLYPKWHAKSGVILATGSKSRYKDDVNQYQTVQTHPVPRSTAYTVYNADQRTWSPWEELATRDPDKFFRACAGSCQWVELSNGDILLPTNFGLRGTGEGEVYPQYVSTVVRCTFDGEALRFIEYGTELTVTQGRGLVEPSLARAGGRYYLTLRNNDTGYVTSGDDGLHFDEPRPWTFDDGSNLGNYNTQQHWVTHGGELYLAYTRRGANNDHVFRHRAPLFIGQVDTDRLCIIRETERILVPERGARLGNFGVTEVSENEVWVVVSEWMQTNPPDPFDCRVCEKHGSDNSIFVAKVRFNG